MDGRAADVPPDPRAALDALATLVAHLTQECGWRSEHIHLLGFAQGGSIALELAIALARTVRPAAAPHPEPQMVLGSVVSVDGPLLQHPTFSPRVPTPVLAFHRSPAPAPSLGRAFASVTDLRAPPVLRGSEGEGEGEGGVPAMPRASAGEWDGIIRWWAHTARWRNRLAMELSGDAVPLS